jgi:hypothetical protein
MDSYLPGLVQSSGITVPTVAESKARAAQENYTWLLDYEDLDREDLQLYITKEDRYHGYPHSR